MHRLRSLATVYRFRMAALLLCVNVVLAVVSIGVAIFACLMNQRELAIDALFGILAFCMIALILWMTASRTTCPLCMTPVLTKKSCSKHTRAKTVLGSHRMRVALSILFKNSFTCPYCLESTAIKVRPRQKSRATR